MTKTVFELMGKVAIDTSDAKEGIKSITNEAKEGAEEATEEAESSGSKLSGVLSKLGSLAVTGAKVAVAGITTVATGLAALTGKAISYYSDYEQLKGGVETLFGAGGQSVEEYAKSVGKSVSEIQGEYDSLMKSQNLVMENAAKAYSTAGLSANDYMETVTSFSASLLQSVGGDTVKAAELADQAIVDMSDNANKMGTDMESIQNAYQGFAKQNYTMLDNLKLGYGGTKEEMERLLEDATALSGVEYDISSYADITEAIHVVQENMGITGTTAKEAATTIQGSISSMKAAWENFMTGMADPDQDFGTLTQNLVDSVVTVAENIAPKLIEAVPKIVTGLSNVIQALVPYVPDLVAELLPALISGATLLISELVSNIPQILETLLPGMGGEIGTTLTTMITSLVDIFQAIIPPILEIVQIALPPLLDIINKLMPLLSEIITAIFPPLMELLEPILALLDPLLSLLDPIFALIESLIPSLGAIFDSLTPVINLVADICNTLINILQPILNVVCKILSVYFVNAIKLVSKYIKFVGSVFTSVWNAIKAVASTIAGFFKGVWTAVKAVFAPVANFFKTIFSAAWNGVKTIWTAATTFFSALWSKIKEIFSAVGTFFKTIFSAAWTAIKNVFSPVVTFFTGVWDSIKAIFDKVGTAIADGISGAVKAAVNSVLNFAVNAINTFLRAINGAISILNKLPGVSIDSISEMSVPALATGGVLEKGQVGLLEGDGAEAVVPLEQNTEWINKVASQMAEASSTVGGADSDVLNKILDAIETLNAQMYNYLVNALVNGVRLKMDSREFGRLVKTYA